MAYALFVNNELVSKHNILPKTWRNISGFNLLNENELNAHNWYLLERQNLDYDTETHRVVGYNYNLENNKVIETPIVEEISLESAKQKKLIQLEKWYNTQINNGFEYEGDFYKLNDSAQITYANYQQLLDNLVQAERRTINDIVAITNKNDELKQLTVAQYKDFVLSYGEYIESLFVAYQTYKYQINAADSIETLGNINVN